MIQKWKNDFIHSDPQCSSKQMVEHPDGAWVKYDDHKAAIAELVEALEMVFGYLDESMKQRYLPNVGVVCAIVQDTLAKYKEPSRLTCDECQGSGWRDQPADVGNVMIERECPECNGTGFVEEPK